MSIFRHIPAFCCATIFILCATSASADILETQKLRFGTWSITNNSSVHSITVNTNGTYNSSPSLIMLSPPQVGVYSVDGLPINTTILSVDVTMTMPMSGGGGPVFTVDNFTTVIPDSNGAGETTLTLGATAKTSGTSQGYPDANYQGELHIEINL